MLFFLDILDLFTVSPSTTTVNEGDPLQLFCIHGGSVPAATITWIHDNDVITTSSRIVIQSVALGGTDPVQISSSLYITMTMPSDGGSYWCRASNQYLPDSPVFSGTGDVTVIGEDN